MKKLISVVLVFCMVATGCKQDEVIKGVPVVVEAADDTDTVLLSDVDTPMYEDVFATVTIDDYCTTVAWGQSPDGGCYAVHDSGYPGFGAPMLFVDSTASTSAAIGSEVKVNTLYGTYYYRVENAFEAILNDAKDNVIKCSSGKKVLNYGLSGERLVMYFSNRYAIEAKLIYGTKIVV